jgi:tetratricopeptide (TPR) repeat protein
VADDAITFVGRGEQLRLLEGAVGEAAAGKGSLVFVAGQAGIGKSLLLARFRAYVGGDPALHDVRFANGSSYEMTGPQDALQPFRDALLDLPSGDEGRRWAKTVWGILRDVGPDLLQLVPGLGAGLAVSARAVVKATSDLSLSDESHGGTAPLVAEQLVTSLLEISRREAPLVVVVEDAHWIDAISAETLVRLADRVLDSRLLVVVTYRPAGVGDDHPLAAALRGVLARRPVTNLELGGLSSSDVELYLERRFGALPHPLLAEWLHEQSEGHPLFITQYVSLLEDAGVIRRRDAHYILDGSLMRTGDGWSLAGLIASEALSDELTRAERVRTVLESRVARLDADQRHLLEIGSVQGRRFWSHIVTEGAGANEMQVLEQLREVADRYQVIRAYFGDSWAERTSDVYEFEHFLLQRAFYAKLTQRQRVVYHHKVAAIMADLVDRDPDPPRQAILELARHSELGGLKAEAARRYLEASESLFAQGAFSEAVAVGNRGLANVRGLVQPQEPDKHALAGLAATVLAASEHRWGSVGSPESDVSAEPLLDEATDAATEVEDHATLARLEYSRAKLALHRQRLPLSIESLGKALTHAEQAEDRVAQLMVLSSLGHHLASQSLDDGLDTLRAAQLLAESGTIIPRTRREERAVQRQRALLDGHLGIGEFDAGHFGAAEGLLMRAVDSLRELGMREDLPMNLAFLAQDQTATGEFESAERTLHEAFDLLGGTPGHAHAGYLRSLWIKLLIEWGHPDEAKRSIDQAWRETEQSGSADVVPLVRNVLAEAMLAAEPTLVDLDRARHHIEASILESEAFGAARGEVMARMLLARLLRSTGQLAAARKEIGAAVELVEAAGSFMPAVRSEEVFFECALVARELSEPSTYSGMVRAAYRVLTMKADSITNPVKRTTFLERVPLSVVIAAAAQRISEPL